jgi:membrane associated rhomboid family serine protease
MEQIQWERADVAPQAGGRLFRPGIMLVACALIAGFVVPALLPQDAVIPLARAVGLSSAGLFGGRIWQLVTYAPLHPTPCMAWLLVTTLLVLLFCGGRLEQAWGTWRFLVFCALTTAASGLVRLLPEVGTGGILVGSAGLLCALLAAFGHQFRGEKVWLLLAPCTISVPYFVIGSLIVMLLFNLSPVANILWLSGAAFGLLYSELAARTWRPLGKRARPSADRFQSIDLGE